MRLHPRPFCPAGPAAQAVARGDKIGLPPASDEERKQWFSLDRPLGLAPLATNPHRETPGDQFVEIVGPVAFISAVVVLIHPTIIRGNV